MYKRATTFRPLPKCRSQRGTCKSANERKDLIEDLNEDGLSDPRRPGPEDLPLILSRMMLIEEAAPYAMDQVNADAFQEAYKDLMNMAARLTQR